MRVCQFRHDGNLNCNAAAAPRPPCQEDQPFYFCSPVPPCQTNRLTTETRRKSLSLFFLLCVSVSLCLCASVVKLSCTPTTLPQLRRHRNLRVQHLRYRT